MNTAKAVSDEALIMFSKLVTIIAVSYRASKATKKIKRASSYLVARLRHAKKVLGQFLCDVTHLSKSVRALRSLCSITLGQAQH